jgi:hypothetical protein
VAFIASKPELSNPGIDELNRPPHSRGLQARDAFFIPNASASEA